MACYMVRLSMHSHNDCLGLCIDESEEDEVAPPLSKRQRIAERAAEGREPIEEVSLHN